MRFEQNRVISRWGEKLGYLFAYFLFTTILYFVLAFLNKIPKSWTYFHIMGIALLIALAGIIIKRLLK